MQLRRVPVPPPASPGSAPSAQRANRFKRATPGRGLLALAVFAALSAVASGAAAQSTLAIVNGKATPVYFNDGDTFRVTAGPLAGIAARLAGFNTLESYGPVHQWKGWTFKELYVNAKQGTLNGRRGVWHCTADVAKRDGYGRVLAECPDLQESQIRLGLAHALSIDGPAEPRLIAAQREAIVKRRGMWAKGVPAQVLTSLHSADERVDSKGNYNRLVSPIDGASTKWEHLDLYSECQNVCHTDKELSRESALAVIAGMRKDPDTARAIKGMPDVYLMILLNEYATIGRVPQIFDAAGFQAVEHYLKEAQVRGDFGAVSEANGSCMIYVKFERRYRYKPDCLKW